jgi:hypothetical protein
VEHANPERRERVLGSSANGQGDENAHADRERPQ